jgi:hypothetical protein
MAYRAFTGSANMSIHHDRLKRNNAMQCSPDNFFFLILLGSWIFQRDFHTGLFTHEPERDKCTALSPKRNLHWKMIGRRDSEPAMISTIPCYKILKSLSIQGNLEYAIDINRGSGARPKTQYSHQLTERPWNMPNLFSSSLESKG